MRVEGPAVRGDGKIHVFSDYSGGSEFTEDVRSNAPPEIADLEWQISGANDPEMGAAVSYQLELIAKAVAYGYWLARYGR